MFKIKGLNKQAVFKTIERKLKNQGFRFERTDFNRPWGGFFVIDENQAEKFIKIYFPEDIVQELTKGGKVSPKILVVAPKKRLSWQYHHRRSEVWRVVDGQVGVMKSDDDHQKGVIEHSRKEKIVLKSEERHRLIGLDGFGIVAEIWQHIDAENPSDENDIVRLQDDFGR